MERSVTDRAKQAMALATLAARMGGPFGDFVRRQLAAGGDGGPMPPNPGTSTPIPVIPPGSHPSQSGLVDERGAPHYVYPETIKDPLWSYRPENRRLPNNDPGFVIDPRMPYQGTITFEDGSTMPTTNPDPGFQAHDDGQWLTEYFTPAELMMIAMEQRRRARGVGPSPDGSGGMAMPIIAPRSRRNRA